MLKILYTTNDKKKNSKLVNIIKSGLSDLRNEVENMGEEGKETEKPSEIVNNVEKILGFNKQNQVEGDLKILTPDQMLSRLPITLAQLKAGSNSEKLKNKIRQLFYSLHRSKKLTKQLYKSLVNIFSKMETIFINTKNSKTNEPHKFRLSLSDKFNLKNPNKNIALGNSSIYYTQNNIKSAYNNNKFRISAPAWNYAFDLPDSSYSMEDIQDYFEFII